MTTTETQPPTGEPKDAVALDEVGEYVLLHVSLVMAEHHGRAVPAPQTLQRGLVGVETNLARFFLVLVAGRHTSPNLERIKNKQAHTSREATQPMLTRPRTCGVHQSAEERGDTETRLSVRMHATLQGFSAFVINSKALAFAGRNDVVHPPP